MPAFERVLLIANPTSGGGKAGRWFDRVATEFRAAGHEVESILTRRAGEGREAAASQALSNALIVAFGGDGTVNEVLNGADLGRCALAVVPAGTGNVLAKELGMSRRPLKAVRQILAGGLVTLDVGVCNGRRFACMFGAGLDASVVKLVHERRGHGLSQWHYVPHVVGSLLRPVSYGIEVQVDGEAFAQGVDQVAVGNTHSYGGPMELTPAAAANDGLFDVVGIRTGNLLDVLGVTARGFLRTLHHSRRVQYRRGSRVVVSSRSRDVPCQVDGEAAGVLPAEVTIQPGLARVVAPPGFHTVERPLRAGG
ncbi:MAG: diacylglycerol/lipid kinase family protein [Planctomycetota bacterium]|jgi:YegS/Rv2252/BmrU family lipid kinase